jgi:RNA polymerase sigma factor (sigma-70 family)
VLAIQSEDDAERSRALDTLLRSYWRPVFTHLQRRWRADTARAEDLTQGFFAAALEKDWLERFDPKKGRFRTFLLACLDAYAANDARAARRQKRGGELPPLTFDLELAEPRDPDAEFRREWARSLFGLAIDALRERCRGTPREVAFALFERYDVEGADALRRPTYAELAAEKGLPITQVTNHLHWARREFRAAVLATLREITASEEEFRAEARELLGVEPS